MSKEYKIWNGLVINNSPIITGITNDSGLTNLSTVLPTSNAVKGYVDNKISVESSVLNSNINSVAVTISGIVSTEISQRTSVDQSLSSIISTEISQRTSADSSLNNSISLETLQRTSVDQSLSSIISTEISQRTSVDQSLSADISILDFYFDTLNNALSTEISTRFSVDSSLNISLSTETSQRISADSSISIALSIRVSVDSSLNTSLSTEISQRISADSSLSTSINGKLNLTGGVLSGNLTGTTFGLTSQLYLSGITNDATPNDVLYYNFTTKQVTFGTKPSGGGGTPGGLDGDIQFNSNGNFSGTSEIQIFECFGNTYNYYLKTDALLIGSLGNGVVFDFSNYVGLRPEGNSQHRIKLDVNGEKSEFLDGLKIGNDLIVDNKLYVTGLTNSTQSNVLYYNTTTKEITYGVPSGGSTIPGGLDTYVQFNDNGTFNGTSGLTFNKTTNDLTCLGIIKGYNIETNLTTRSTKFGYESGYNEDETIFRNNTYIGYKSGYSGVTNQFNTFVGNFSGYRSINSYNTFIGYSSGYNTLNGHSNVFIGVESGHGNISNNENVYIGYRTALNNNSGKNTIIGTQAGFTATSGLQNVFIGYNAGYYETGSNKLFIDNQSRSNETLGRTSSLIYGLFNIIPIFQELHVNAKFYVSGMTNSSKSNVVYYDTDTGELTYSSTTIGNGTVTSISAGNGMNFSTITNSGTISMGTPSGITTTSTNLVNNGGHSHSISGFLALSGGTMTGVLNGTQLNLSNKLFISGLTNSTQSNILYYNITTKEITYGVPTGGGSPSGLNTYIQFNSGNTFSGSSNLTWDGTSLNVSGNYNTLSSNVVLRSTNIGVSDQVNNLRETYSSGNIKIEMYDTIWKKMLYIQNDYGSNGNIFAGYYSGHALANGLLNTGYGTYSLLNVSGGSSNTAIGANSLNFLTSGSYCTAIGVQSGEQGNTSNGIYIGAYAGKYETVSNKLFIDSLDRTDESTARSSSLIYGIVDSTASNQELYLNSKLFVRHLSSSTQSNVLYYNTTTKEITYGVPTGGGGTEYQTTGSTTFTYVGGTGTTIDTYSNTKDFAVYFYTLISGTTEKRAGIITINNNTTTVYMNESTTTDIGNTSSISFSVDVSGGNVRLKAISSVGGTWTCKFIKNII